MKGSALVAWPCAVPVISGIEATIATAPATPLTIALTRSARYSRPCAWSRASCSATTSTTGRRQLRLVPGVSDRLDELRRRDDRRVEGDRRAAHHQVHRRVAHARLCGQRLLHVRLARRTRHPANRDRDVFGRCGRPSAPPQRTWAGYPAASRAAVTAARLCSVGSNSTSASPTFTALTVTPVQRRQRFLHAADAVAAAHVGRPGAWRVPWQSSRIAIIPRAIGATGIQP